MKPADQLRKPGSCGKPYGGIEIRIVKEDGTFAATGEAGELFVRTTLAMDGYHRTAEKLSELDNDEWKSVGDVAYTDEDGFVYICDRKRDMIISGGVNIYPAEIEAVLYAHPQVLDAAVFGIPDEEWGERVHAIVQPKPGQTIDLDELRAFAEPRLARLQAATGVRDTRRAAAYRLGQAAEARAARRVLAGSDIGGMSDVPARLVICDLGRTRLSAPGCGTSIWRLGSDTPYRRRRLRVVPRRRRRPRDLSARAPRRGGRTRACAPNGEWSGVALACNVDDPRRGRRRVCRLASRPARRRSPNPSTVRTGRATGYVADPEGNRWEIAWVPGLEFDASAGAVTKFGD